jgi:hypothetical protein
LDYVAELQQMNVQNAIKGGVITKLAEILPLLTKEKLNLLAGNYEIKGRSKLKKQELADTLYSSILDAHEMSTGLLIATAKEWDLVKELLAVPALQDDTLFPGTYLFLMNAGLLYSFYDQDKLYYVLPEEIKETYAKVVVASFLKERERSQQVHQYILAAMNLYGVSPVDTFLDIFNAQNEEPLTEDEFDQITDLLSRREQSWHYDGGRLISDYFDPDNEEELDALLERMKDKPYYIPAKLEFLKYADPGYFEQTPQLAGLEQYILQFVCKDKELVTHLMDDIQLACSMEEPVEVIMAEFERRGIEFETRDQLEMTIQLIINVYNHTRVWSNGGYSPVELRQITSGEAPVDNVVPFSRPAASGKIGRNEPCPCGSGKKYKKCCG